MAGAGDRPGAGEAEAALAETLRPAQAGGALTSSPPGGPTAPAAATDRAAAEAELPLADPAHHTIVRELARGGMGRIMTPCDWSPGGRSTRSSRQRPRWRAAWRSCPT